MILKYEPENQKYFSVFEKSIGVEKKSGAKIFSSIHNYKKVDFW